MHQVTARMATLFRVAVVLSVALPAVGRAATPSPSSSAAAAAPVIAALPPTDCPAGTPLASGTIATIAGTGVAGTSGDGGPALAARISTTVGPVTVDQSGAVYFNGALDTSGADYGSGIRRIGTDGTITTFAGPSTGAPFVMPTGLAFDAAGDLIVADAGASRIWRVTPDGTISALAGTGTPGSTGDDGPAARATISADSLAIGPAGDIYINDVNRYRRISPDGIIHSFAGTGVDGFSGEGGPALDAMIGEAEGLAADAAGNVYLADAEHGRVYRVDPAGTITTFAGTGPVGHSGDGGPATMATLNAPAMLAVGDDGSVYVDDHHNDAIRKVDPTRIISTVAGSGAHRFLGRLRSGHRCRVERTVGGRGP